MATSIPFFGPPVPATYTPSGSPQAGQVNQLKQRGENPSEIAAILGVTVATVDNDLGIPAQGAAAAAIQLKLHSLKLLSPDQGYPSSLDLDARL
jgi:hypothetical protein